MNLFPFSLSLMQINKLDAVYINCGIVYYAGVHGTVAKITEAHQNYRELTAVKEASQAIRTPIAIFRG